MRNVRTVVTTLDYLSNITGDMHSPTLVCEAVLEEIVGLSFRDGLTGLFNYSCFSEYFHTVANLQERQVACPQ